MGQRTGIEPSSPPAAFEAAQPSEGAFLRVLERTCRALERSGIEYGLLGGVASAALGRPRWTHDIDVFVRPEDAPRVLDALAGCGFATHETNPNWIYKALSDGVLVDVLFRAKRDVYFDDEMAARCRTIDFRGVTIRTVPPEDLAIIKAVVHDEDTPRHWFDAVEILAAQEIDWEYFIRRAISAGPKRVLSLLAYATSVDVPVPESAIAALHEAAFAR